MSKPPNSLQGLYPIGAVSEMTGVNAITLRAWERRYALLTPQRTDTGRRLYSQADVDCIKEVLLLMEQGIPIGQMKEALQVRNKTPEVLAQNALNCWQITLDKMIAAIIDFDEAQIDELYNEMLSIHPIGLVTQRLLIPLLRQLGSRWEQRLSDTVVAEEHFFGVYLRNKLGARFHHQQRQLNGPVILAACLPGEQHETGILLFALAAQERGYQVILFGANMPLEPLVPAAKRVEADAIVLSGSYTPADELLTNHLPGLCQQLDIPVFIGGKVAKNYALQLSEAGAIPTTDELESGLHMISQYLPDQP
ncbi:MAG: MerR family transcriptional regulator [Thiolinea sp.]